MALFRDSFEYLKGMPRGDRKLLVGAVVVLLVLVWWFAQSQRQVFNNAPIADIYTDGSAKRRGSHSLEWSIIRGSAQLYLRDTVFTPADTTCIVTFPNGTVFSLQPNSMVQFDEVNPSQVDIILLRGNIILKKNPQLHQKSSQEPARKVSLRSMINRVLRSPAKAPSASPKRPRIIVRSFKKDYGVIRSQIPKAIAKAAKRISRSMDATIHSNSVIHPLNFVQPLTEIRGLWKKQIEVDRTLARYEGRYKLKHLKQVRLDLSKLFLNELAHYNVLPKFPKHYSIVRAKRDCIQLAWTPVPLSHISYYVEISRDKMFRYVRSYGTEENFLNLQLNDTSNTYYWRVRAVLGDESLISNLNIFQIPRTKMQRMLNKERNTENYFPEWEVCYL